MAKISLEDQALDYSKPFVIGLWIDGKYVEKVTHPLKSMVRNMIERGLVAPWDTGVLKLLLFAVVLICGSLSTIGCKADHSERDAHIKRYCEEHLINERTTLEKNLTNPKEPVDKNTVQWIVDDTYKRDLASCINDTLAKAGQ
jgi:hypothetical protein